MRFNLESYRYLFVHSSLFQKDLKEATGFSLVTLTKMFSNEFFGVGHIADWVCPNHPKALRSTSCVLLDFASLNVIKSRDRPMLRWRDDIQTSGKELDDPSIKPVNMEGSD